MYEIENNVPLPVNFEEAAPWSKMTEGQSFFVPARDASLKTVTAAAERAASEHMLRFEVHKVEGGARVWCRGVREYDNPYYDSLAVALGERTGAIAMNDLCEILALKIKERRAAARDITGAMKRMGWTFDRASRDFLKGDASRRLIVRGGTVTVSTPR